MTIKSLDKIEKLQPHFKNQTDFRNTNETFYLHDQPAYLFTDCNSLLVFKI